MLDTCVNQFSFRCDESSGLRIKMSVMSVRQMAVSVCGEMMLEDPLSTCMEPLDDGCSDDTAWDCSFNELSNVLCTVSDNQAHCR